MRTRAFGQAPDPSAHIRNHDQNQDWEHEVKLAPIATGFRDKTLRNRFRARVRAPELQPEKPHGIGRDHQPKVAPQQANQQ